ncbi:Quinolinate synthase A [Candidatus Methanoperedenaceae archaeon GB50]|nr:Quinolinate synthase A [Candidatus Methanoperedenaceae archaeon GB50]CAD7779821.1 MAG: Quinolinate synthase A [Candidatus Methanoperedenaceae archaeon GB50]
MVKSLVSRIRSLKKEKNAVILAHNYVRGEIQNIADFVGDSLELARRAMETDSDVIVFCGVDFMAETASILNPEKKVLIPDPGSICPMAQMLKRDDLVKAKEAYPDADLLLYINTLADCKALADCVCTSANADRVVEAMDSDTVIFGPDRNLARFVEKRTSKRIIPIPEYGLCPTHHQISVDDLLLEKSKHPGAEVVVHPECVIEVQEMADCIASTSGMARHCSISDADEFLIGTETGLIYRLERELPEKRFYPVSETAVCPQMKMHTLKKVEVALELERPVVSVEREVGDRAREAIERMLRIS